VIDTGKFSIKGHSGGVFIRVKAVWLPPSPVIASAVLVRHSPTWHAAAQQLSDFLSY
jgi:hypothetical protein